MNSLQRAFPEHKYDKDIKSMNAIYIRLNSDKKENIMKLFQIQMNRSSIIFIIGFQS